MGFWLQICLCCLLLRLRYSSASNGSGDGMSCSKYFVQPSYGSTTGAIFILEEEFLNLQLTCWSELLPPLNSTMWLKDNETIDKVSCGIRMTNDHQGLVFTGKTQICHGGLYTCVEADTDNDTCFEAKPFSLQIMLPSPEITGIASFPLGTEVTLGSSTTLSCTFLVTASHSYQDVCIKGKVEFGINKTVEEFEYATKQDNEPYTFNYTIEKVEAKDIGIYNCKAALVYGGLSDFILDSNHTSYSLELTTSLDCANVSLKSSMSQEWYFIGDYVTVNCSVDHTDPLLLIDSYEWTGAMVFSTIAMSSVSINTSTSGTFDFKCSVQFKTNYMFIAPPTDKCTSNQLCITIRAKSPPQAPVVQDIEALSLGSVSISWTVPYQSDWNENYTIYYTDHCSLFFSWLPDCYEYSTEEFSDSIPVPASVILGYDIPYSCILTDLIAKQPYCYVVVAWNSLGLNASTVESFQIMEEKTPSVVTWVTSFSSSSKPTECSTESTSATMSILNANLTSMSTTLSRFPFTTDETSSTPSAAEPHSVIMSTFSEMLMTLPSTTGATIKIPNAEIITPTAMDNIPSEKTIFTTVPDNIPTEIGSFSSIISTTGLVGDTTEVEVDRLVTFVVVGSAFGTLFLILLIVILGTMAVRRRKRNKLHINGTEMTNDEFTNSTICPSQVEMSTLSSEDKKLNKIVEKECHQMCSKHDEDTVTNLTIPVAVFPKYVREILAIGGFEDQFQLI